MERLYNSGKFRLTLDYLLEATAWRPFELFCRFGAYAAARGTRKIPLERYTEYVWDFFGQAQGVESEKLRDRMVCDRLAGENTGRIPPCLYREDKGTGALRRRLEKDKAFRQRVPERFGLALLYHRESPMAVAADYRLQDPITGRYPLIYLEKEGKTGPDSL